MVRQILKKILLWRLKRQGLQYGKDFRVISWPKFGSEPYLISIGNHVTIVGTQFITHDGATWVIRDRPEFKNVIKYGRITVYDNCFVGPGTTIMPGVSIGPNSIVAAGAVVTRNVPPGEIWGGVPARRISFIDDYARRVLEQNPLYDAKAYKRDKRSELLRLYPYPS